MKSEKIYLFLLLFLIGFGVNVNATETANESSKEMINQLEEKEEDTEKAYESAISDLELNKQRDILTQEQIDEFIPSLINSTTVEQIEDNMTKFYLKYNVYPKLEFNERVVNMKNYILGLISEKKVSEEVGNQFIHQIDQALSYDGLNAIQQNVDALLAGSVVVKKGPDENKQLANENDLEDKRVTTKESIKKEQKNDLANTKITTNKDNEKQVKEVITENNEKNDTKNNPDRLVNQNNRMSFLPKTGISSSLTDTAVLSMGGFFLFISVIAMTEIRNNRHKSE